MITRLVRNFGFAEVCFYVESMVELSAGELAKIRWLIAEYFEPLMVYGYPQYADGACVEIGPRINVETPFSSNAKAICVAMGLHNVVRLEQSTLFGLVDSRRREDMVAEHLDVMTQAVYPHGGLTSFTLAVKPEPVKIIPVLDQGEDAVRNANKEMGLGFDKWDIDYVCGIFRRCGRNPTDVELFQIAQGLSEHCRHWFWRGKQEIDGVKKHLSLMQLVQAPLKAIPGQDVSVLAFNDNVGALHGFRAPMLVPERPGQPSKMIIVWRTMHPTATAETHNHPCRISPYGGASTGIGGRIRDNEAGGRGSMTGLGFTGYAVGNLFIPGYLIPGEAIGGEKDKYPTPLRVLLDCIEGVADYGNQYGEPSGGGFTRAFCQVVSGERREFRKPILYSGGIGSIDAAHVKKNTPQKGWKIVAIGGPAYPVGKGGGAASSMGSGQNASDKDYDSVQRGDGEMGNKTVRPLETCVQMGDDNPIEAIHDQGAGGPSNVLTELMETIGGKVEIRNIVLGDKTMSVLYIWSAEYQERYGLLIKAEKLELFQQICTRERVNCEVLGEITGDSHVTVTDSETSTMPVHLELNDLVGKLPQKTFVSEHPRRTFSPAVLPANTELADAMEMTFKQLSVCSKGFIVHRKDRAVGGRVALQQCCGPSQIPIADFAVLADSHFALTGSCSALGEQSLKILIDPKAGARMSVAETLTNMMGAGGIKRSGIRCRANWMWPAKMQGEGALLYDAAFSMRDAMIDFWIACDGGKDSLSMSAEVGAETVKAPGELVILGYASMPDITKILTPDIKAPGESLLGFIDLGMGKTRLGGSAFLQSMNQLGDKSPDCDPRALCATWDAVQALHSCGALLSLHDRSDGGLAATVVEMCLGGICGFLPSEGVPQTLPFWFNEELGIVVEFLPGEGKLIERVLADNGAPPFVRLGRTSCLPNPRILGVPYSTVRQWWESTGYQLKLNQRGANKAVIQQEFEGYKKVRQPVYELTFKPVEEEIVAVDSRPIVAILREEGSNSDREMKAAITMAGMDAFDIHMSDLLAERATLDDHQMLIPVGGFSFKDTFGSAKGQAGVIKFNERLKAMFDRFYNRPNTLSFAPCNGFQLWTLLGWVPFFGLAEPFQPRLITNISGRFESRWTQVKIMPSPAIMLKGMEGSILGVHCDHGEGQLYFPDSTILDGVVRQNLVPVVYVDPDGEPTQEYPYNPNGSASAIAGLCSKDGRHFALMPHPERTFLRWQWHYWPREWSDTRVSPWMQIFVNARKWLVQNR